MAKPNENFKLSVEDVEHIERALHLLQFSLDDSDKKREIIDLLAKFHHQKIWFRPKNNFVSG